MPTEIILKELSYVVNGCVFDVHNEVGPGLREECYQKAMERRCAGEGLPFLAKPATRREFVYRNELIHVFEPDLVVSEQMILELKAQPDGLPSANFSQLLSYLKFWDLRLGLLVNFAQSQAVIERVPFSPTVPVVEENYDFIRNLVTTEVQPTLRAIHRSLLTIHEQFGAGYGDTTYRKLVEVEVRSHGLECQPTVAVHPEFRGVRLPSSLISPLVVGGTILVEVQALHDEISSTSLRTMQTHLRVTGRPFGLIAIFGKKRLSIRGVHP